MMPVPLVATLADVTLNDVRRKTATGEVHETYACVGLSRRCGIAVGKTLLS